MILQIKEYWNNQIRLDIDIKNADFITNPGNSYGYQDYTNVTFVVDIKNRGKQPTTISAINFFSEVPSFTDLKASDNRKHMPFEPIRLEANDRIKKDIFVYENIYLKDRNSFSCTLEFETSHKTITKKITASKED